MQRLAYLDGWRGLAILFVIEAHFVRYFESFRWDFGRIGVDVFFCLSGMLMSRILFVRRLDLVTFYKRRLSRILPVFVVFVCVVFGGAWLSGHASTWAEFFYTLTFLRTYLPLELGIWESPLPIGHLWSLNVEEHCYLVLGLLTLVAAVRGREGATLLLAGTAAIVIHLIYIKVPVVAPRSFDQHTEIAASHLLISAGYFLWRERFIGWVRPWMPVATFLLAIATYLPFLPGRTEVVFSPFLLAFTVNHLDATPTLVRRFLSSRPLCLMGIWSYSIYLWQQPFFQLKSSLPIAPVGASVLAFVAAMATALASFYLLESPTRRWLNANWK